MAFEQLSEEAFKQLGAPELVYVRPLFAGDLQSDPEMQTHPMLMALAPDEVLFGLYGAGGERLAVMSDRDTAIAAANAHELYVMTLH